MAPKFRYPYHKCVKRLVPKTRRGIIVGAINRGGAVIIIACPPGKLDKNRRCKVGTVAVEEIKAARGGKCPAGFKRG